MAADYGTSDLRSENPRGLEDEWVSIEFGVDGRWRDGETALSPEACGQGICCSAWEALQIAVRFHAH
jgi:hypothetical protein